MEITNLADAKLVLELHRQDIAAAQLELDTQREGILLLNIRMAELERWLWHRRLWLALRKLVARIRG